MKKLRKLYASLLAFTLIVTATACGTNATTTTEPETSVTEEAVVETPEVEETEDEAVAEDAESDDSADTEEAEDAEAAEESDDSEATEATEASEPATTAEQSSKSSTAIEITTAPAAEQESQPATAETTESTQPEQSSNAEPVALESIPVVSDAVEATAAENTQAATETQETADQAEIAPPYYIEVNRSANTVRVWCNQDANGNWTTLVREMICSTGRAGHETPTGTYKIFEHTDGGGYHLMVDGTYGRYCMRWKSGGYMFHSVCYAYNGAPEPLADEVAALGTSVSRGCIRLSVADAQWMYNNMSNGTVVYVY